MRIKELMKAVVSALFVWSFFYLGDFLRPHIENLISNFGIGGPPFLILVAATNIIFFELPLGITIIAPAAYDSFGQNMGTLYFAIGEATGACFWFFIHRLYGFRAVNWIIQRVLRISCQLKERQAQSNEWDLFKIALARTFAFPLIMIAIALATMKMRFYKFFTFMVAISLPIDYFYLRIGRQITPGVITYAPFTLLALFLACKFFANSSWAAWIKHLSFVLPTLENIIPQETTQPIASE